MAHLARINPGGPGGANYIGQLRGHKRFKLTKKLGAGSFGDIFLGVHVQTGEEVAVKLEGVRAQHPQLLYEGKVIRHLRGGTGIPEVHWIGTEGESNVMIIEVLGSSLEDLFNQCHRRFSLKTVLMVGEQCISRLEYVHSRSFLHRDVKPDNFLMGKGKKAELVYVIDFGLSKRYMDPRTQAHIPYRTGKSLTGTARYASVNTHLGLEQGRRDDLEGLCYVLLYFLRGVLPWQGLQAANQKDKYHKICLKKQNMQVRELCKGLPSEFGTLLTYCRNLKFDETPNYNYCRRLLRDVFESNNYTMDYVYDWTIKQESPTPRAKDAADEGPDSASNTLKKERDTVDSRDGLGHGTSSPIARASDGQARDSKPRRASMVVGGRSANAVVNGAKRTLVPTSDGKEGLHCRTQ